MVRLSHLFPDTITDGEIPNIWAAHFWDTGFTKHKPSKNCWKPSTGMRDAQQAAISYQTQQRVKHRPKGSVYLTADSAGGLWKPQFSVIYKNKHSRKGCGIFFPFYLQFVCVFYSFTSLKILKYQERDILYHINNLSGRRGQPTAKSHRHFNSKNVKACLKNKKAVRDFWICTG